VKSALEVFHIIKFCNPYIPGNCREILRFPGPSSDLTGDFRLINHIAMSTGSCTGCLSPILSCIMECICNCRDNVIHIHFYLH